MIWLMALLGGTRGAIATAIAAVVAFGLGVMLLVNYVRVANLRVEVGELKVEAVRLEGEMDKCVAVNAAATDLIAKMTEDAIAGNARADMARKAAAIEAAVANKKYDELRREIDNVRETDDGPMSRVLQRTYDGLRGAPRPGS